MNSYSYVYGVNLLKLFLNINNIVRDVKLNMENKSESCSCNVIHKEVVENVKNKLPKKKHYMI